MTRVGCGWLSSPPGSKGKSLTQAEPLPDQAEAKSYGKREKPRAKRDSPQRSLGVIGWREATEGGADNG